MFREKQRQNLTDNELVILKDQKLTNIILNIKSTVIIMTKHTISVSTVIVIINNDIITPVKL